MREYLKPITQEALLSKDIASLDADSCVNPYITSTSSDSFSITQNGTIYIVLDTEEPGRHYYFTAKVNCTYRLIDGYTGNWEACGASRNTCELVLSNYSNSQTPLTLTTVLEENCGNGWSLCYTDL